MTDQQLALIECLHQQISCAIAISRFGSATGVRAAVSREESFSHQVEDWTDACFLVDQLIGPDIDAVRLAVELEEVEVERLGPGRVSVIAIAAMTSLAMSDPEWPRLEAQSIPSAYHNAPL